MDSVHPRLATAPNVGVRCKHLVRSFRYQSFGTRCLHAANECHAFERKTTASHRFVGTTVGFFSFARHSCACTADLLIILGGSAFQTILDCITQSDGPLNDSVKLADDVTKRALVRDTVMAGLHTTLHAHPLLYVCR
jgi:phosphoribosyl 1,2-cyclic phosphodiesterase